MATRMPMNYGGSAMRMMPIQTPQATPQSNSNNNQSSNPQQSVLVNCRSCNIILISDTRVKILRRNFAFWREKWGFEK